MGRIELHKIHDHLGSDNCPADGQLSQRDCLRGFRTIFSSFHHFGPEDARSDIRSTDRRGERYSIRKAVIGSSREARQAGTAQEITATTKSVTPTSA